MIMSRHPVPAALFMIISLVSVAALFVLLEAFFLAILQVLVYAGAVMVLFLFIIMLLDVGPDGGKVSRIKVISGLAGCLSFGILVVLLLQFSGIGSAESRSWQEIQSTEQVNGASLLFSTQLGVTFVGTLGKEKTNSTPLYCFHETEIKSWFFGILGKEKSNSTP